MCSCVSTDKQDSTDTTYVPPTDTKTVDTSKKPEVILIEEPTVVVTQEPVVVSEEYTRSVGNLANGEITTEMFNTDKEDILKIISELSAIMKSKDYNTWLRYLTPESIEYWSTPRNLAAVSQRLPIKNYKLKDFQDYFEKVFILSRINRVVDEIRYDSKDKIKAVQFLPEQDIIYYNFEKRDGNWLLKLDTSS